MHPVEHSQTRRSSARTRRRLGSRALARHSRGLVVGGLWLRFGTWLRTSKLDAELARGVDPLARDELSLRTGQLGSPKTRARLAASLVAALELADRQLTAAPALKPLVPRAEVWACRGLLLELAERLRGDTDPNVQGLAIISRLVTRPDSPLRSDHAEHSLHATLRAALLALEIRLS
jgi:hypothetical protein